VNDLDLFGTSLAGIGDVNGDGVPDMMVGAENAVNIDDVTVGSIYVIYLTSSGETYIHLCYQLCADDAEC
jgi:hypothetical protein